MKNNKKHLQYERLRSCHNIWACPSITSSLSTESALNWGLIMIEEMAMLVLLFYFGSSRLPCPQCWWMCVSIISDLILYNWENVVSIYLFHSFVL